MTDHKEPFRLSADAAAREIIRLRDQDKNPDGAIQLAREWLNHRVNDPLVMLQLGKSYEEIGGVSDARATYQRALKNCPGNRDLRVAYAQFEIRQGNRPPRGTPKPTLQSMPSILSKHMGHLSTQGKCHEAIALGEKFIKQYGDNIQILMALIPRYNDTDQFEKATSCIKRAQALEPDTQDLEYMAAAQTIILEGDYRQGIQKLSDLIKSKFHDGSLNILKKLAMNGVETNSYRILIDELKTQGTIPTFRIEHFTIPAEIQEVEKPTRPLREFMWPRREHSNGHVASVERSGANHTPPLH